MLVSHHGLRHQTHGLSSNNCIATRALCNTNSNLTFHSLFTTSKDYDNTFNSRKCTVQIFIFYSFFFLVYFTLFRSLRVCVYYFT